jgi:hypothetical protein
MTTKSRKHASKRRATTVRVLRAEKLLGPRNMTYSPALARLEVAKLTSLAGGFSAFPLGSRRRQLPPTFGRETEAALAKALDRALNHL